ncbi:MAG TPA: apolipoprotein N-acyltransferase [Caulobacteraceae bacterium]|nr:apolipoprotein N-acyltransferase [Caulobacteraceae bacterium]
MAAEAALGRLSSAALAVAAGLAIALAFPPFGLLPGLGGFALIMALAERASAARPLRSAFWRGWLAGTAFFAVSAGWVWQAFQVDAAEQGWMAPFAVALLASGLGLFWGAAALSYRWIAPGGLVRPLVFAGAVMAFEWLRGHLLTGFPWDLPGEAWRAGSPPSEGAALVGAYGLSWITVAIAATPVLLFDAGRWRRGAMACLAAALALVALYAFGAARMGVTSAASETRPVVRIVQPDLPELPSYDTQSYWATVEAHVTLTARPAARRPDIIVWPERAIPGPFDDYLSKGDWQAAEIAQALQPGQLLLTGGYRRAPAPPGVYAPDGYVYFNSLIAVARDGDGLRAVALYDKFRLVPFGEYLPLARWLAPLHIEDLTHVGAGFSAGPRPRPLALPGAPLVQPLICYESLYPGFAREGAIASGRRAAWIVNVSDDAWFGGTYGPIQHLNLASYRAIEEGLPIVRATPTGVSAVIDAFGRVQARLDQGRAGVVDAVLPPALPPTLFDRFGEASFVAMMLISALFAALGVGSRAFSREKRVTAAGSYRKAGMAGD